MNRIVKEVSKISNLTKASEHYIFLLDSGIDRNKLDAFIDDHHNLKVNTTRINKGRFTQDLEFLFDLGGVVAGGGALARIFGTHKASDYDVFFNDPVAYAKAILATRDNKYLDICFFSGKPYDSFDIALSKCSFTRDSFDVHMSCIDAIENNRSDIFPERIVNASATLRRVIKYHGYTGVRFRLDQILTLCAVYKVGGSLASEALKLCD